MRDVLETQVQLDVDGHRDGQISRPATSENWDRVVPEILHPFLAVHSRSVPYLKIPRFRGQSDYSAA
jgi:hypothetical protein